MTEYEVCCSSGNSDMDFYDMMERKLMAMTFLAHKELLFEKIKEQIEKQEGKKLEKIAELLVNASKEKMDATKEFGKKQDELREKLKETFEE